MQLLLTAVKRSLRIERTQIAVDATSEAHVGQAIGILRGRYQSLLRSQLLVECTARRKRVVDFAEGSMDRFFVLCHSRIASDFGHFQIGNVGTPGKNRHADLWRNCPSLRVLLEQAR